MKEYLQKYRGRIILMGLSVFLLHGAKLHSEVIGIDTEDIIHIQKDFYDGWLGTGRQGLFALKWLTDSLSFHPFMAQLFTLIFFTMAVSAFFMIWDRILCDKTVPANPIHILSWAAGGLFLISHPIMTEQFYFTLQSVEICIGMLFTAISLYLIVRYREAGKLWRLLVSALLQIWTFSVYQTFVVMFIFGTVSILLLRGIARLRREETVAAGELLREMLPFLGVFFAAFAGNTLITQLFFYSSDYLGGQILWGKYEVIDNLRAIAGRNGHIVRVLTGRGFVHYHYSFGLLCLVTGCLIVLLCVRGIRSGNIKKSVAAVIFFYLTALFITPFLMTFLCGGMPVIRSQLVLPMITGLLAYLSLTLLFDEKRRDGMVVRIALGCMGCGSRYRVQCLLP